MLNGLEQNYDPGVSWIDQLSTMQLKSQLPAGVSSPPAMPSAPMLPPNAKLECLPKFGQPQQTDLADVETMIMQQLPTTIKPDTPVTATHGSMTARIEANGVKVNDVAYVITALSFLYARCHGGGILSSGHTELRRRDLTEVGTTNTTNTTGVGVPGSDDPDVILPANLTLTIYQPGTWSPGE
ncbi:MAG: hypothetical protein M1838_000428 [Thelocarpon superellum]|nr:MAG: hypothetical protein M1838_000428 [Thelocarpon superellum]